MQLLGVVPSDLLLLFKTSDCLRHLDLLLESDLNTSAGMLAYILFLAYSCILR